MSLPSRKKTHCGKRKKRTCHTGRRHTPNAPDPILDCGGVPWCISDDTTNKSIKFTDFDDTSTEPVCMPLVYWSTQTTAAINRLRGQPTYNSVYLPYVSPATTAAKIIQRSYIAYTKHVNLLRQRERDTWERDDVTLVDRMRLDTLRDGIKNSRDDHHKSSFSSRFAVIQALHDEWLNSTSTSSYRPIRTLMEQLSNDVFNNGRPYYNDGGQYDNIVGDNRLPDDNG